MPANRQDTEFITLLTDLLQIIGPVTVRRMFGAHGIFLDGLMFGLVDKRTFYLKADRQSEHEFQQLELAKFSYLKQSGPCSLAYYEAPADALDDAEVMRYWGNLAFAAALRAAAKKKKQARKP